MSEINLHFFDGIDTAELEGFAQAVNAAQAGDTVVIDFCNGGGSVFHGIAMCDMMASAKERDIQFVSNVWGYAASAACLVALSADRVFMSPNSALMYHSAWCINGNEDQGIQIANAAQQTLLAGRISKISASDFNGEDHWVTSQEATKLGIIDGIIGKEATENTKEISVAARYIIGGKIMNGKIKAEEEIIERKFDEEEKKEEAAPEAECGGDREDDPKAEGDMDIMEAIVQRLEEIEHRLAVLEGEGKKADDEMEAAPSASARRKALLAKLSAVCAPVQPVATKIKADTVESRGERCKNVYANFDSLLADYIKRK